MAANVLKRTYPQAEEDKVAVNDGKVTYSDAVLVASHTTSIAANVISLSAKAPTAAPTFSSVVQCDNRVEVGTSGPSAYEVHAQQLFIHSHNDAGITIAVPNDKRSMICFGSAFDADLHHIANYNTDSGDYKQGMHFKVGGADNAEAFSITRQSGANRVGVNLKNPAYGLDVNGTLHCNAAEINFSGLPTTDPTVAGRLYRDSSNYVRISIG